MAQNLQHMKEKKPIKAEQRVAVIYYLSRNGQLEHPHFMVVPLSSPQGLYLKDVISRLTILRGQSVANMYSWSSKRSYKNGFVWHDLTEEDLIYPCQGHEYVLKGSQILESCLSFRSLESAGSSFSSSSSSSMFSRETNSPGEECLSAVPSACAGRKNRSCGSFDELNEYQVFKPKTSKELASKATSNASTQTPVKSSHVKTRFADITVHDVDASSRDQTRASTILMDLIKCGSKKSLRTEKVDRKD